jgi:3-phosphoshikimate 1-carboxyvinyltransferase
VTAPVATAGAARLPGTLIVTARGPLTGTVRTPGDKSVSHRAVLLSALAEGTSSITGLSDGADVHHTLAAVAALGVAVRRDVSSDRVELDGGRSRLGPAPDDLDCGNSGTGMRLLAGILAGLPFTSRLVGDQSLSSRPMDRIAGPLAAMGARIEGDGPRCRPPLTIAGGPLRGIEWEPPVASAQVKSAILLAGLDAEGETVVRERVATRAHTEEMLAAAGADISVTPWGEGTEVRLRRSSLRPLHLTVPGDPSQAAFWVVAGAVVPGSRIEVVSVYAGPARLGFVEVLRRMGAHIDVTRRSDGSADLTVTAAALQGTVVDAAEIPSLDEVPVLAVAAAAAAGTTVFRAVGELRVKESDRLAGTVALVRAFGAAAETRGDDLVVHGVGPGGRLVPGRVDAVGDHRMAMAATVAALAAAPGSSTVSGFEGVATSYPGFLDDLSRLTAGAGDRPEAWRVPLIAIDGPAGAGKSTVSAAVARRLGLERLDTGAMYRAVAWAALARGTDPTDAPAVVALAGTLDIAVGDRVTVDGTDVTEAIRSPEVSRAVSAVAATPGVRRQMVEQQRRWARRHRGGVVEGRDIGTVVFPDADLKVFLTASPEERARRRHDEAPEGVARRDRLDSSRATSPLVQAADARLLDTTDRAVEDVVEEVLAWL